MNNSTNEKLTLKLTISDPIIIKYLTQFEEALREEKAQDAIRVGVIAIQSASPTLDTKIVDQKFHEIEKELKDYTEGFKKALQDDLKKYFEQGKGDVPLAMESVFGEKGSLQEAFKKYFNLEDGKLSVLLKDKIGPNSDFSKSLDPSHKDSVINKIEEKVKNKLEESIGQLKDQFSLDKQDSGMSRIKLIFEDKVEEIKELNSKFFLEIKTHLGVKEATAIEAERGTQKGRDFETDLYVRVALLGRQLQDDTENVSALVGNIERSKTGDYAIALGMTSGAPGKKIVIETKKEEGYRFKDAIEELKKAKENRGAESGIFVFAKGYEPDEFGDFKIEGNDFYCTVDESLLYSDDPLLFLESAYKIARILIISGLRKAQAGEIDLDSIRAKIKSMVTQVELMSGILTKAKTIQKNGELIAESIEEIKKDLETNLTSVLDLVK